MAHVSNSNLRLVDDEPPAEPAFWHYSPCTVTGDDHGALRTSLFKKLGAESFEIVPMSAWKYELHFAEGLRHVVMELHFFKTPPGHDMQLFKTPATFIAEINRVSGDNRTFWNIWKRLIGEQLPVYQAPHWPAFTPKFLVEKIKDSSFRPDEDTLAQVGLDASNELLVPFFKSSDLNVVRAALERYDGPVTEEIFTWADRSPGNFLEKRIYERVQEILKINSRL